MKKVKFILLTGLVVAVYGLSSCRKCKTCYYQKDGQEIELGKECDEYIVQFQENNGHTVDSVTYEVYCKY